MKFKNLSSFSLLALFILLLYIKKTSSFTNPFQPKRLTSPCNVIGEFNIDPKIKQLGATSWENMCPDGRFIQAVWSRNPKEPFRKAKCCESQVDATFSWEIRDVSFHGNGESNVYKKWNVECDKYSVITGN